MDALLYTEPVTTQMTKKRAIGPLGYISLTHSHTGGWKWLASRVAISS